MGVSTVTAARSMSQFLGGAGEENALRFEHFPNLALSGLQHQPANCGFSSAESRNRAYLQQLAKVVQRDPTFIE